MAAATNPQTDIRTRADENYQAALKHKASIEQALSANNFSGYTVQIKAVNYVVLVIESNTGNIVDDSDIIKQTI